MTRTWGWLTIAAGGVAVALLSRPGQRWMRQAGQSMRERYPRLGRSQAGQPEVEAMVEEAVTQPHRDTVMAQAFEQAVQAH
jgi:hypothetical protein